MPKPKDAKVWNSELVDALRARQEQCRRMGKQRQFLWRDGADTIEAVRRDIYVFGTGKIVGLPNNLKKTVDELVRNIIAGKEPKYPPGYVPLLPSERKQEENRNPYLDDPYLKKIKSGGGAVAILMAFHVSGRDLMTKDEICSIGQQFCDDVMEANYFQGRPRGAWNSNQTLSKHGLIQVNKTTTYNAEAGGFRSQGKWTYALTRSGEKFIEALLQTRPALREQVRQVQGSGSTAFASGHDGVASSSGTVVQSVSTPPLKAEPRQTSRTRRNTSINSQQDERELRDWASSARPGQQTVFQVGKTRRKHLHDVCDDLNETLQALGRWLRHESDGKTAHSRALFVTMMEAGVTSGSINNEPQPCDSPSGFPEFQSLRVASLTKSSPPRKSPDVLFSGRGHTLEASPAKRPRSVPASVAAADAAFARQAAFESKNSIQLQKNDTTIELLDSDSSDSDLDDRKMPARQRPMNANANANNGLQSDKMTSGPRKYEQAEVFELLDSESDDDIPPSSGLTLKKADHRHRPQSTLNATANPKPADDMVDLTSPSPKARPSCQELTIVIDNRERNRNKTPRTMRTELTRMVQTGHFSSIWPGTRVDERSLDIGDFAFEIENGRRLAVSIERKRVSDLVQRSFRKDHWKQFLRMRDASTDVDVFLIEGDFRTASQYTAFGSQETEEFRPSSHAIENEESLIRFIGRAILSSKSIRFFQSKDELGSLRAVAAVGIMSVASGAFVKPKDTHRQKSEDAQLQLTNRLKTGGVPAAIAARVAEELGSEEQLDLLYGLADDEETRNNLLVPLIDGELAGSNNTAAAWSTAIHKVYFSALLEPSDGKKQFDQISHIVKSDAALLGFIHCGMSSNDVINNTLNASMRQPMQHKRLVLVNMPESMKSMLPDSQEDSFYKHTSAVDSETVDSETGPRFPVITMQTCSGSLCSAVLRIFIVEGQQVVDPLLKVAANQNNSIEAARSVAQELEKDCCCAKMADDDTRILLVRGLQSAFDAAARLPSHRPEFRALVDMVIAELMLVHDIVVLQALKKNADCKMIVQQLALACYHFQLLTHRDACDSKVAE